MPPAPGPPWPLQRIFVLNHKIAIPRERPASCKLLWAFRGDLYALHGRAKGKRAGTEWMASNLCGPVPSLPPKPQPCLISAEQLQVPEPGAFPRAQRSAPGTPRWSRRSPRALCPVPGERELKGSKRAARSLRGCGQGVDAGFALPGAHLPQRVPGAAGAFPARAQGPCALPQPGMLLGADFLPGPLCGLSHGRFIALSCPGQGEFWWSRVQGDCGLCLSLKGGKVLEHLLQNCLSPQRQEGLT